MYWRAASQGFVLHNTLTVCNTALLAHDSSQSHAPVLKSPVDITTRYGSVAQIDFVLL